MMPSPQIAVSAAIDLNSIELLRRLAIPWNPSCHVGFHLIALSDFQSALLAKHWHTGGRQRRCSGRRPDAIPDLIVETIFIMFPEAHQNYSGPILSKQCMNCRVAR